ncbi:uncharacterized protein LOC121111016 isoform X1 [Gallus gallus]|uniref:uncharacterized protein LOC121111016 isoform X1 n=1 Tax=Gallus gallus TaxID=9031 RepID=UPI001EFF654A|nr:uncharacterized protein LOC121111016 isoform X1 [Gallus gallus]
MRQKEEFPAERRRLCPTWLGVRSAAVGDVPSRRVPSDPIASHRIAAHPGGSVAAWGGGDLSPPISDATGQCGAGVTPQMAHSLLSAASSGFEILERGKQHNAAFRGNRLCAQQIRAVDKLTALRRVYDFIDLRQRLASMETALLAPEPRRGTSGFVLLDLGKAHLYRARCTVGHVGAGREDCKVKTPLVAMAILGGCEHSQELNFQTSRKLWP